MLRALLVPITGGILLACCFFPAPAHWLAWIGLIPVAAAIASRRHLVATCVGMYCAGLVFNLVTTDWIRTLDNGVGLSGGRAPDWLLQSQLLALFWPITLLLGRLLVSTWSIPLSVTLPVVWTLHEAMLRNVWALLDQTGWQVYRLGYAIADHDYISQIADLGGVSALGFVVACTSGAVWDLVSAARNRNGKCVSRGWIRTGIAFATCLLVLSSIYGVWRISQTRYSAGPSAWLMPEHTLKDPPDTLPWKDRSPGPPDVLLWSELAYHLPPSEQAASGQPSFLSSSVAAGRPTPAGPAASRSKMEQAMEALCRHFAVPSVIGYTRTHPAPTGHKRFNSAAYLVPSRGLLGNYDKIGLVPWTEFTPIAKLSSRESPQFSHGEAYPVFTLQPGADKKTFRFAAAICYDIAFPNLFRRFMRSPDGAPDFFLVCSSERCDSTGKMSRHVLNMARIRAIECRRTIVRNVRGGHSGRIDSTGRLRDQSIPLFLDSPTPLESIPIDGRSTLYVMMGDWIPPAILIVVLAAIAVKTGSRTWSRRPERHGPVRNRLEPAAHGHADYAIAGR